jgi:hypothetical protein
MDRSLVETLKERTETELRESLARLPAEGAAVRALLQQRMGPKLREGANRGEDRKYRARGRARD